MATASPSTAPRPDVLASLAAVAWTLEPLPPEERRSLLRDEAALLLDRLLVRVARGLGALEVAIGEGLDALSASGRLIQLGPSCVADYAREKLDLAPGNALGMVRLARALRERPLLRAAVRRGEVTRRRAETVVAVARGAAEAAWVARARGPETVRELAVAVRAAGSAPPEDLERTWERVTLTLAPGERTRVDAALALAGDVLGAHASPWERLEVVCQEFLAAHPIPETEPEREAALPPSLLDACRDLEAIKEGLEYESRRWEFLETPERFEAPDSGLAGPGADAAGGESGTGTVSVWALDARLRELCAMRASWDELVGHLGLLVIGTGVWRDMMYASIQHYAAERLGMSGRALEQRAALERKLWCFPALRAALREKRLTYEQVRVVAAHATEATVDALVVRAEGRTVLALRRELEDEAARSEAAQAQMCGRAERTVWLPARVAALLAAAAEAARQAAGRWLGAGEALALAADHFVETWGHEARRPRTPAQRALARDRGRCSFPGCSRPADQGHHVTFRSHGGSDALANMGSLCALCRERHKAHYADSVLMPRAGVKALSAWPFSARDAA